MYVQLIILLPCGNLVATSASLPKQGISPPMLFGFKGIQTLSACTARYNTNIFVSASQLPQLNKLISRPPSQSSCLKRRLHFILHKVCSQDDARADP